MPPINPSKTERFTYNKSNKGRGRGRFPLPFLEGRPGALDRDRPQYHG
jgi:hypothetical protein